MLTTRQVEAWLGAIKQVKENEPSLNVIGMTPIEWHFYAARGVILAGLIEDIPSDTDIDTLPAWQVDEIGSEWAKQYGEAMTIPKKNGLKKLPITFMTKVKLPLI